MQCYITCSAVFQASGGQQRVAVHQVLGMQQVEARDQGGRGAVDPQLLSRLHGLRGVRV